MKIGSLLKTNIGMNIITSSLTHFIINKFFFDMIDRKITSNLLAKKEEGIPYRMITDKQKMVHNIFKIIDRWMSNKNVSRQQKKAFLRSFISFFIEDNATIRENFHKSYGMYPPGFLTLSPTKKCNLKCSGCYASSSSNMNISLDYDIVDRIIQEENKLWGAHFTVISGGEPFLYKSHGKGILDLAEQHPDNYFLVYTNGTLIDKTIARRIAELGNITPAISVEGFQKETDKRRGNGVYNKILNAFNNLHAAGALYGISVTATRDNAELILSPEFIDYYMRDIGAYYMWIFQYMPIGRGRDLQLMVTPEQRLEMFRRSWELVYDEELFIADFWNSATASGGCISAGRHGGYIYIDWNGNVMPCVFNPYTMDNVVDVYKSGGNLNDVLFSPLMEDIREWYENYLHNHKNGSCSNMLLPCPVRDHYDNMRKILLKTKARPLDKSAEIALYDNDYYKGMCEYDKKLEDLMQEVWKREYLEIELPYI